MRTKITNINRFTDRHGFINSAYTESIWTIVSNRRECFHITRSKYSTRTGDKYIHRLVLDKFMGKGIFGKFMTSPLVGTYRKELHAFDIYDMPVATKFRDILGGYVEV